MRRVSKIGAPRPSMVIDVHCHVGSSDRRLDAAIPRFTFERDGAAGRPGYDGYMSLRFLRRPGWWFVRRWLGIDPKLSRGAALDARIDAVNEAHWSRAESVDRMVLLAFDEYRDDAGQAVGPADGGRRIGSDLYVSNSHIRALCAARPDRFLFGGSIHPYRVDGGRDACEMLAELAEAGVALIKWLPIHQNIRADDPRTVAFLRQAAALGVPMLIHYGGEMSVTRQHRSFLSPVPMLAVLRDLRRAGEMPTVIIAHVATPSFSWQRASGHRALVNALLGEFSDAPLYADISALSAFGRTPWLRRLAGRKTLHRKLVWGSDYPVPAIVSSLWRVLDRQTRQAVAAVPSWIEQSLRVARAAGFEERVFTRSAELLRLPGDGLPEQRQTTTG